MVGWSVAWTADVPTPAPTPALTPEPADTALMVPLAVNSVAPDPPSAPAREPR